MRRLVVGLLLTLLAAPAAALDLRGIPLPLTYDGTAVTSTVPLVVPVGSAANASVGFAGEVNSGIYRPAAGTVAISSLGTNRLLVSASNVAVAHPVVPTTTGTRDLGTTDLMWRDAYLSSSVRLGTNPASAGAVRLANTATIAARNAANDGDVTIATVNASDQPIFGAGVTQTCAAAGDLTVVGGIITACTAP